MQAPTAVNQKDGTTYCSLCGERVAEEPHEAVERVVRQGCSYGSVAVVRDGGEVRVERRALGVPAGGVTLVEPRHVDRSVTLATMSVEEATAAASTAAQVVVASAAPGHLSELVDQLFAGKRLETAREIARGRAHGDARAEALAEIGVAPPAPVMTRPRDQASPARRVDVPAAVATDEV